MRLEFIKTGLLRDFKKEKTETVFIREPKHINFTKIRIVTDFILQRSP